jgi:protein-S-isoprenylcysteine O-methyltransferase Ste14
MKGRKINNYRQLLIKVLMRLILAIVFLWFIFFLPAGSIKFWEAWVYMGILFIPMILVLIYLLKKDPELLERRMKMKEKEAPQKVLIKLSYLVFFIAFIIPGFDYRFGWSKVPFIVIIIADLFIFIGYLLFFLVLKENTYASRIIEVEKGQKVISTGPYAVIRHPLYIALLIMYVLSPLALGSYWAVLAMLPLPVLIIFRIRSEETVLLDKLPGYREYAQKVKYRLMPYLW